MCILNGTTTNPQTFRIQKLNLNAIYTLFEDDLRDNTILDGLNDLMTFQKDLSCHSVQNSAFRMCLNILNKFVHTPTRDFTMHGTISFFLSCLIELLLQISWGMMCDISKGLPNSHLIKSEIIPCDLKL